MLGGVWLAVFLSVVVLSLLPGDTPASDIGFEWLWNLGHVPAYALLSALTFAVVARRQRVRRRQVLVAAAGLLLFALALELLQPLLGRTASGMDIALTAAGVALGAGAYRRMARQDDIGR